MDPTQYQFADQQLVSFDNGVVNGSGRIVGCVDSGYPIVGRLYIVEPTFCNIKLPNEIYPFKVISIFEIHINKEA